MTGVVGARDRPGDQGRRWTVAIGSIVLSSCLPPATLQPAEGSVAESTVDARAEPARCRVLIGERDREGRLSTREVRWGGGLEISVGLREGLVLGDAQELVAITLERRAYDSTDLYGDAMVRCEEDVIMMRELAEQVARPLVVGLPSCFGEVDGEQVSLSSTLQIVSGLGPYLGWREVVDGVAPEPTSKLAYHTVDVRDGRRLEADVWLLEPTETMKTAFESVGVDCKRDDAPQSPAAIDGFAIRWSDAGGPRLLAGYRCCGRRSCELDEPLPKTDAELAARLPDPDRLLHSPLGCGSLGLDGQLRTRDGVVVGSIVLDARKLVGVLFLPADHPFELDW
ncbi:MAG TPA: hypothetical protein VM869_08960 [Enhygromyxa sp.]|nr:hypothetical protein [Enhygromyxa sp.]